MNFLSFQIFLEFDTEFGPVTQFLLFMFFIRQKFAKFSWDSRNLATFRLNFMNLKFYLI